MSAAAACSNIDPPCFSLRSLQFKLEKRVMAMGPIDRSVTASEPCGATAHSSTQSHVITSD